MSGHRRSIRLNGFDYSSNGYYFVTICLQNRDKLFGEIDNGQIILNEIGEMVLEIWNEIPNNYNGIEIDEFIIMPDHIHGILIIKKNIGIDHKKGRVVEIQEGRTQGSAPTIMKNENNMVDNVGVDPCVDLNKIEKLGIIIKNFKTLTTKIFIDNVKENNWPKFNKRLWQRDYYERIIRNEKEYFKIKEYIKNNPKMWGRDRNNIGGVVNVGEE